jgi:hypothetical protein
VSVTFSAYNTTTHEFEADELSVNMANANAAHVLSALGLDTMDLAGGEPAETFLGRVLMALAVAPADAGVPAHTVGSERFIDCGRSVGYLQERLSQLHELALSAKEHGCEISWA